MSLKNSLTLLFTLVLVSCSSDDINTSGGLESIQEFNWTVPINTINGTFDLYDLAENPILKSVDDVTDLDDSDHVAMVQIDGETRVYPYKYISSFESINDKTSQTLFAITYCPQTKSAICFDRSFEEAILTLRASGYLHLDNLVAYDENTDSYWSQMKTFSIKGQHAEKTLKTFQVIETKWETIKTHFKEAQVFTSSSVPKSNETKNKLEEVNDGELIFGILDIRTKGDTKARLFPYSKFRKKSTILEGSRTIIWGNESLKFVTAFNTEDNSTFQPIADNFPNILIDEDNNTWNVFGVCVDGPRKGERLESPNAYVALGWAWQDFFDEVEVVVE